MGSAPATVGSCVPVVGFTPALHGGILSSKKIAPNERTPPRNHKMTEIMTEKIETFVHNWLSDSQVPGAALAIVDQNGIRYSNGFGARELKTNAPATDRTLFGIGSCTKSFTTLAIMQLVEAGQLEVEDPVSKYLPLADDYPGPPVTVLDLMTHSSGIPSDGMAVVLIQRYSGSGEGSTVPPLSSRSDFEAHVRGSAAARDDGDRFFYYNSGYTLLGEIIEAVTGQEYAAYIESEILEPLGMERSTFEKNAFESEDDRMTPYYKDDEVLTSASFPFDECMYAPGGLLSSVRDLSSYLQLQMNGGSFNGETLVNESSITEMHDRHATRRVMLDGTRQEYGFGWMIQDFLGDTLVGHGGSVGVSNAYVGFLEDAGIGIALLCNAGANPHPMYVAPAILAIQQGDDETAVPQFALREKFARLTRTYESYRGIMKAKVESNGGTLSLLLSSGGRTRELVLVPESLDIADGQFYTVTEHGDRVSATFEETSNGYDLFFERWRLHSTE
ncbi:serine hydrolase [Haladaptatus pallidirubidus]|nr:serine hydrolase [Haladaptatus pallidirubidus]